MNQYKHDFLVDADRRNASLSGNTHGLPDKSLKYNPAALELIQTLCQALASEGVTYCHWKSNNAIHLSASGVNDLDLLIGRADALRFARIMTRLGFKPARTPQLKLMPGVSDYFGYDEKADVLVHVHAHFQLILGHDMTKNYRLPIEHAYLASAVQNGLFKIPAPEFEYIVFVIRMIFKHSTWDVMLGGEGRLNAAERQELAYLKAQIDQSSVAGIMLRDLPYIDLALFNDCVRAIEPDSSIWLRVKTGHKLQRRLKANARRPWLIDVSLKLSRRITLALRRFIFQSAPKYRLESGGAMIAIVGGDGAGKSTAADGLNAWLTKHFETTSVHMGKPSWSWKTITIRSVLKIGNLLGFYPIESSFHQTLNQKSLISPGYPWLLREVCCAQDRYRAYLKARRFAANGGLVILDRFPLPQIKLMDGPQTARFVCKLSAGARADQFLAPARSNRLTRALVEQEESFYHQMVAPELLFVLRVDPEIAVQRKPEEDATSVRERSTSIWEINWDETDARVIDASKSRIDVLNELKALIWSVL